MPLQSSGADASNNFQQDCIPRVCVTTAFGKERKIVKEHKAWHFNFFELFECLLKETVFMSRKFPFFFSSTRKQALLENTKSFVKSFDFEVPACHDIFSVTESI